MKGRFLIILVVVTGVISHSLQNAHADGKYFPEKAYKAAPAIPSQRAILVYRNGIEKLVIESSLDGKGQEFGWVIPLPSKPKEFEKTSPGLIKTFNLVLQPDIIHDLTREIEPLWRIVLLVTFGSLIVVGAKRPDRILWLVLLFVVFVALFSPHLGIHSQGTAATDIPGVRVHDVRQVGSYEITVLETESSRALDAWLEDNGFAGLSEEDEKIVSDYVQDGWYFVAVKLRRQGDGYSRPHPLSMSFYSNKAIYPFRLTATVGSNVYLELYVIADEQATCDVLTLEVSDAYRFRKERKVSFSDQIVPFDFAGKTHKQNIGHTDAAKFMWDGCVVSKLCGILKPHQMDEDLVLQLKKSRPHRKRYYSRRGARDTGLAMLLRMWCFLPVLFAVVYHRKRKERSGRSIFIKTALVPSVLLSSMVWVLTYAALPKINVRAVPGGKGSFARVMLERRQRTTEIAVLAHDHDNFAGMGKDEIAKLMDDYFTSKNATNIYNGEPLKHEDSPGDYTIIEDERGIVWRTYSMEGYPDDFVIVPTKD